MALISDTHRFMFVHIYKTGGTSIQKALSPFRREGLDRKRKHVTIRRLLTEGYGDLIEDYHVFTAVRNPFSRMVSIYFYHKPKGTKKGFGDYVRNYSKYHKNPHWKMRQFEWVSCNGKLYVDTVLRFESLKRDFDKVCKKLGIRAKLPHVNKSHHCPYKEYYTPELRDIIEKRYRSDLEHFNYSFKGI